MKLINRISILCPITLAGKQTETAIRHSIDSATSLPEKLFLLASCGLTLMYFKSEIY